MTGPAHIRAFPGCTATLDDVDDGRPHFRAGGRIGGICVAVARPGDAPETGRRLLVRVAKWGQPAEIRDQHRDTTLRHGWYVRGCLDLASLPPLVMRHGGPVIGKTATLVDGDIWCDAIVDLHEGEIGDCLLDFVDRGIRVPISPTYEGKTRDHRGDRPGLAFVRGRISELAVVTQGAFEDAHIVGRTSWPLAG